jgi:hypothetical protein
MAPGAAPHHRARAGLITVASPLQRSTLDPMRSIFRKHATRTAGRKTDRPPSLFDVVRSPWPLQSTSLARRTTGATLLPSGHGFLPRRHRVRVHLPDYSRDREPDRRRVGTRDA